MTAALTGSWPLVAVVSRVPLLSVAVAAQLDGVARVEWFPAERSDLAGLLGSLGADAVVVDSDAAAAEATVVAAASGLPLVHVCLRDDRVRVLRNGQWVDGGDDSAGTIRNVLLRALFGKEVVA